MRRSPIAALAAVAYAVILADLLSKLFALSVVGADPVTLTERFRLAVVHNDGAAFGLPLRQLGLEASTIIIFLLILLMLRVCRELTEVDRYAPVMLGLIAGAGAANHMDMLVSPLGVVDFIAFGHIVFNVADIALVGGLALCARTAWLLVVRIAGEHQSGLALATGGFGGGSAALGDRGDPGRRSATSERVRQMTVYREPETAMTLRTASDSAEVEAETGTGVRRSAGAEVEVGVSGWDERSRQLREGASRRGGVAGLLAFPRRFDRAATPALVIACSFILLYSLAIVWLPDAGRSAPNAILLALGVFGSVFLAVYVDLVLADRRSRSRSAAALAPAIEAELARPISADLPPSGPSDLAPDAERPVRNDRPAARREDGDWPRSTS